MNEHALAMARQHAPCYLYSREALTAQAEALRGAFPGFDILFSVKANPFPPVVRYLASLGIGADAASAAEGPLAPQEPLFTGETAFPITALPVADGGRIETVDIVGNLCCAADVLAKGFTGPALEVGDLVAVGNTGAYARTLSPLLFSGHEGPAEFIV